MTNEIKEPKKKSGKDMIVKILLVVSIIYLIYPSLGVWELIPDATPLIGSLDEGVATTILLSCLSYYGYNITDIFKKK